jgi:hypothetical protein
MRRTLSIACLVAVAACALSTRARADLSTVDRAAPANDPFKKKPTDKLLARTSIERRSERWTVSLYGHRRDDEIEHDPSPAWVFTLDWRAPSKERSIELAELWSPDEKQFGPLIAPFDTDNGQMLLVRIPGMIIGSEGWLSVRLYDVDSTGNILKRLDSSIDVFDGGACSIRSQVKIERNGSIIRLQHSRENRNPHAHPSGCATIRSRETVSEYRLENDCYVSNDDRFRPSPTQCCVVRRGLMDCDEASATEH